MRALWLAVAVITLAGSAREALGATRTIAPAGRLEARRLKLKAEMRRANEELATWAISKGTEQVEDRSARDDLRTNDLIDPSTPYSVGDDYDLAGDEVVAGDFDDDGDLDFVSTESGSTSITMLANDGHDSYSAGPARGVSYPLTSIATVDFEGDHRAQVAVTLASDPPMLAIAAAGKEGELKVVHMLPAPGSPIALAADLNGDGKTDLVLEGHESIGVWLRSGNGFSPPMWLPAPAWIDGMITTDLDRDGRPEIVLDAQNPDYETSLVVWHNAGDGTFPTSTSMPIAAPTRLVAGDFDHDGWNDLAMTATPQVVVLWNGPAGFQETTMDLALGDAIQTRLVSGDIDRDGVSDLIVVQDGYSRGSWITTFLGRTNRNLSAPDLYLRRYYVSSCLEPLTLIQTGGSEPALALTEEHYRGPTELVVLHHSERRRLDALVDHPLPIGTRSIQAVDFDAKGRDDILIAHEGGPSIIRSTPDGDFAQPEPFAGPYGVAIDLDGDGRDDLVLSNGIARRRPDGSFDVNQFAGVTQVFLGDFDGDGAPDVATVDTASVVSTRLNDGQGNFLPPVPSGLYFDPCRRPSMFAAGDFDGEGRDDIAMAWWNPVEHGKPHQIVFAINEGDRHFAWRDSMPLDSDCQQNGHDCSHLVQLAVTDLDGDGLDDLAPMLWHYTSGVVHPLINDGHGGFSPEEVFWVPEENPVVHFVDVDRDGLPDAICQSGHDGVDGASVIVRMNGHGRFTGHALGFNLHSFEFGFTAGDFNGDGRVDLATSYHDGYGQAESGGLTVLFNRKPNLTVPVDPATPTPRVSGIAISAVAPNPARGAMSLGLELASGAPAEIALLDVSGRRVATAAIATPRAGRVQQPFAPATKPRPGIYWLRLTQGAAVAARKITILD